jgi:phosphatidylglycerol---prolipoprotein diacylglyceryl transferase
VLTHPQFDPIAFSLGPVALRWYGLMYVLAFVLFVVLGKYRARRDTWRHTHPDAVDDIMFYGLLGVIIGGRLGYVIFYKPEYYLNNLSEVLAIWRGGMSFHGGFLGVLAAMAVYARRHKRSWLELMDFIAPLVPLGIAAGRMGNFINGELPGRIIADTAHIPWAMWFPQVDAAPTARHPSQLYQFAGEGIALFVLLWLYSRSPRPTGAVAGAFLAGYGAFRFTAEFAREPDSFLGLLSLGMSMGQWLSLPMIFAGLAMMVMAYRRH